MAWKIQTLSGSWPPGGFPFVDPKTGKKFDGMSADLSLQTENVLKHRRGNPNLYDASQLSFESVRQEITDYICGRTPSACVDGNMKPQANPSAVSSIPPAGKKCYKCNHTEFDPVYCTTCSGHRLRGWKCKKCGTENQK